MDFESNLELRREACESLSEVYGISDKNQAVYADSFSRTGCSVSLKLRVVADREERASIVVDSLDRELERLTQAARAAVDRSWKEDPVLERAHRESSEKPIPYEFVEELGTEFDGIRMNAKTAPDAKLALPNRQRGKE